MKVKQNIIDLLDTATTRGHELYLPGDIDRKTYREVDRALVEAGGRWSRQRKAHVFEGDAAAAIEPILSFGEIVSEKRAFEQFFTPPEIADEMARLLGVEPGDRVLEPSVGEGALARAVMALDIPCEIMAYEIHPATALKASETHGLTILLGDFKAADPSPLYDKVIMNPPFHGQQDVVHVLHAWQFLKPGGTLVAILSPGWQHRKTVRSMTMRNLVKDNISQVKPLPPGVFKAAGTMVETVMVVIEKPEEA